ncbi:hypothetical protein FQR65_LT17100 [Abscondita terminalis]|nr:hypothetical protein FQR65_LT17100 [Abscondita terminalis]
MILALDLGTKTIGMAKSSGYFANPHNTLRFEENNFDLATNMLLDEMKSLNVKTLVIGNPINMDGSSGHRAQMVDDFIDVLLQKDPSLKDIIVKIDERLTTRMAKRFKMNIHPLVKEVLYNKEQIDKRTKELAEEITNYYNSQKVKENTITIIGLLKGCIPFMANFLNYFHYNNMTEYMVVSSYLGGTKSANEPKINLDLNMSIKGQHILIVEDIIDSDIIYLYGGISEMIKKIGVLTSGGDAPGMNAAVAAVIKSAISKGIEPYIIKDDFATDIISRGGTVIGSARLPEFKEESVRAKGVANLKKLGIEALVVIGGDGSYQGAEKLTKMGINCVGIPGTIDNDIVSSDYTVGFDTALNTVVRAVDSIRDTMQSHNRCAVVEIMGNGCGDLTLYSATATGAEVFSTKESMLSEDQIVNEVKKLADAKKRSVIVLIAEKVYESADKLAQKIEKASGYVTRATVLGHTQRGGTPTAMDRHLAVTAGIFAVEQLVQGNGGLYVGLHNNKLVARNIEDTLNMPRPDKTEEYKIIRNINKATKGKNKRTKIITTIGPSTSTKEDIKKLFEKGMNVVRLNFSHGTQEEQLDKIKKVLELRKELNKPISLMLDTKGPEIRIGKMKDGKQKIKANSEVRIYCSEKEFKNRECSPEELTVSYDMSKDLKAGNTVLVDDGKLNLTVMSVEKELVICKAFNTHDIKTNKRVNLPGVDFSLPFMSEKDKQDIIFSTKNSIDYVAASFVNTADNVNEIRKILKDNKGENIQIISKIESKIGIKNIDEIIEASDGIMIARGDLGLEIPYYEVPF